MPSSLKVEHVGLDYGADGSACMWMGDPNLS
jgi:hypothetical protein